MPTVHLTAFFKDDDGHGWSETHDIDGGSGTPTLTTFLTNFNNLMINQRRPLLGGDAFYIGCRASYKTANGQIAGDNIELDPPMRGPQTFSGTTVNTGPPEAAIKMRLRNAGSTQRSDVYIRGQWNQCVAAGVLDFVSPIGAEWKKRADAYGAALIAGGYGWVGIDPVATSRGKCTGYTQNMDTTVTLNLIPTNGVNLPAAGTRVSVKFSRLNASKSILNRAIVSTVDVGAAAVTTVEKIAVSAFETEGTYIAAQRSLIAYAAVSYYKLAHRKTGRPFGVAPGRLRAQTLH